MKKYFLLIMLLSIGFLKVFLAQDRSSEEVIKAKDLRMNELFSYKVEFKDTVSVGEPVRCRITLTYLGNEPVFITAYSDILYKMADGTFKELHYIYNKDCMDTDAALCVTSPPSPLKLLKGETYEISTIGFHKGDGSLFFEKNSKYEVCFEVYFPEIRFGKLGKKVVLGGIPKIRTGIYTLTIMEPQGQDAQVWTEITNNGLKPFLSPYDSGMMGCMIKDPAKLSALEKVIQNYPNALLTDRLRLGYALALLERGKGDPMKNWEKANTLIDSVRNKDEEYYRTLLGDFEYYGFKESVKAKINEKIKIIYKDLSGNAAFADFLKEWKAKKERQQRTLINERSKYEIEERLKEEKRKREERRKQSAKEGK